MPSPRLDRVLGFRLDFSLRLDFLAVASLSLFEELELDEGMRPRFFDLLRFWMTPRCP